MPTPKKIVLNATINLGNGVLRSVMKFIVLIIALSVFSTGLLAGQLTNLKIDFDWRIKYDSSEWNYIYFKEASPVSGHIFEHKTEKFRLILQKETHINPHPSNKNLVQEQCAQANKYYFSKFNGSAQVVKLNKTDACFVEYKKNPTNVFRQYLIPENNKKTSYELFTYSWSSEGPRSKEFVEKFLKGFLK